MSSVLTQNAREALLNGTLQLANKSFYLALMSNGAEVSGGTYVREPITLGAVQEGSGAAVGAIPAAGFPGYTIPAGTTYLVNTNSQVFPMPGVTGTPPNQTNNTFGNVTGLAIFDAATGGNQITTGNLDTSMQQTVSGLLSFVVNAGEFIVSLT
jgi:hypothetical protein